MQTLAWAVDTLAHEAFHLRGILDEARDRVLRDADDGLDGAAARGDARSRRSGLALLHWETSPAKKPDQYQVRPGCEDGGRLDVRPADPVWP